MHTASVHALSRWTLRLDGGFLVIAGGAGMLADTIGHFFGVGPMADARLALDYRRL